MKNYIKIKFLFSYLLVIFFISNLNKLNAQHEIGLRYMPTFSEFEIYNSGNEKLNAEFTLSNGYGAFVGLHLTDYLSLQGEVLYSSKAQKYRDQDEDRKINLKY